MSNSGSYEESIRIRNAYYEAKNKRAEEFMDLLTELSKFKKSGISKKSHGSFHLTVWSASSGFTCGSCKNFSSDVSDEELAIAFTSFYQAIFMNHPTLHIRMHRNAQSGHWLALLSTDGTEAVWSAEDLFPAVALGRAYKSYLKREVPHLQTI